MKRLAVITATRAEYGLLSPIIKELRAREDDTFRVDVIVTGTHLNEAYGMTKNEIVSDDVRIDFEIDVPMISNSPLDISHNQAEILNAFAELFSKVSYDAILILGDRYELLAISIAAGNALIPIFHISGGDVTEGAIDECIRHSITKMAYLHFPTSEPSRKRIIQLGENPDRVFNYGSTSIDNELAKATLTKEDALASIGLDCDQYAVCTFHPVTLEDAGVEEQVKALLSAIGEFPEIGFVVTKSNADRGGSRVNELLDEASCTFKNVHVYPSLGVTRYLSLMRHALFVLGNSSSGIIETPAFHIPTVNIGDRQRGRLRADSIIDCEPTKESICEAIRFAMSAKMREICKQTVSPYGDGNAAPQVAEKCVEVLFAGVDLKKTFYDLTQNEDFDM